MLQNFNFKRNSNRSNKSASNKSPKYYINNTKDKVRNSFVFTRKKKSTKKSNNDNDIAITEGSNNYPINNSYNSIKKKIEMINQLIELDGENEKIIISSDNFEMFKKLIRYDMKNIITYSNIKSIDSNDLSYNLPLDYYYSNNKEEEKHNVVTSEELNYKNFQQYDKKICFMWTYF